jgi:hypothetical protein
MYVLSSHTPNLVSGRLRNNTVVEGEFGCKFQSRHGSKPHTRIHFPLLAPDALVNDYLFWCNRAYSNSRQNETSPVGTRAFTEARAWRGHGVSDAMEHEVVAAASCCTSNLADLVIASAEINFRPLYGRIVGYGLGET